MNMTFSKRHRWVPPACAGELESQHQCDTADSRSGGLHMWWRTPPPAQTQHSQEAFLWTCADPAAQRHPCPTCAGKPQQYSCAEPSALRLLTCTWAAKHKWPGAGTLWFNTPFCSCSLHSICKVRLNVLHFLQTYKMRNDSTQKKIGSRLCSICKYHSEVKVTGQQHWK